MNAMVSGPTFTGIFPSNAGGIADINKLVFFKITLSVPKVLAVKV